MMQTPNNLNRIMSMCWTNPQDPLVSPKSELNTARDLIAFSARLFLFNNRSLIFPDVQDLIKNRNRS